MKVALTSHRVLISKSSVSEELFPSGPWVGFYNHRPGDRQRMDLQVEFANGQMTGEGIDGESLDLLLGGALFTGSRRRCAHESKASPSDNSTVRVRISAPTT